MPAVVSTMETISTECGWNSESSQKAASLLTAITQFEFLMTFVITKCGFGFIKGLTVPLQSHSQDICNAYNEVGNVKSAVRSDVDTHHKYGMILPLLWETQSIPHHPLLVDVLAKWVDVIYQVTLLKSIIGEQLPFLFWMSSFHTWILVFLGHNNWLWKLWALCHQYCCRLQKVTLILSWWMNFPSSMNMTCQVQHRFHRNCICGSANGKGILVSCRTLRLKPYSMLVPVCSQTFIVCSASSVHYQSQAVRANIVLVFSDVSKLTWWGRKG